jgi:hypothetical protein
MANDEWRKRRMGECRMTNGENGESANAENAECRMPNVERRNVERRMTNEDRIRR